MTENKKTVTFGEAASIIDKVQKIIGYEVSDYEKVFVDNKKDISSSNVLKEMIEEIDSVVEKKFRAGELDTKKADELKEIGFFGLATGSTEIAKPSVVQTAKEFLNGKQGEDNIDNAGATHIRAAKVLAERTFKPFMQ